MKKWVVFLLALGFGILTMVSALADMILEPMGVFNFAIGIDGNFDFTVKSGIDCSYGESYIDCFCDAEKHDIQTTYQIEEATGCPFEITVEKTGRRENDVGNGLTDTYNVICTPRVQPVTAGYYPFIIRMAARCGVEVGWAECEIGLYVSSDSEDFTWTINNSSVTITGYQGTATAIAVPHTIQDLPVTAIGKEAFYSCKTEIESVYLPESITSIGEDAFYGCTSLRKIQFSKNIFS